jgi:hypothetical protein
MKQLIYLNYMLSLRKKTIKMLLKMAIFVAPQVSFCLRTTSGSSHARGWEVDVGSSRAATSTSHRQSRQATAGGEAT